MDAVVVGSGPNGLAAALTLAQAGRSVRVLEAADTIGGGARSAELTLPGFSHDVCSAVHPLARGSPFFETLPLRDHGLAWIDPPSPLAHPFDDGSAVLLERDVRATASGLGDDGPRYERLFGPLAASWPRLAPVLLAPLPPPVGRLLLLARFGMRALWPAARLSRSAFRGPRARALFAGLSAHGLCRSSEPPRPRSAWCSARSDTRSAGRSRAAARRRSRMLSRPSCAASGARSSRARRSRRSRS
jgi:phytoene dehydrogenase-like protein